MIGWQDGLAAAGRCWPAHWVSRSAQSCSASRRPPEQASAARADRRLGGLIPGLVPTILAHLHGERRDVAYAEAGAMSYAFAVLAPLAVSMCLWFGLGWRAAMLLAVATGA